MMYYLETGLLSSRTHVFRVMIFKSKNKFLTTSPTSFAGLKLRLYLSTIPTFKFPLLLNKKWEFKRELKWEL